MSELDKWAAEKCDITVREVDARYAIPQHSFIRDGKLFIYEWRLSDARCREIVREHFKIITNVPYDPKYKWMAHQHFHTNWIHGKTPEEAELACIAAIREGEG